MLFAAGWRRRQSWRGELGAIRPALREGPAGVARRTLLCRAVHHGVPACTRGRIGLVTERPARVVVTCNVAILERWRIWVGVILRGLLTTELRQAVVAWPVAADRRTGKAGREGIVLCGTDAIVPVLGVPLRRAHRGLLRPTRRHGRHLLRTSRELRRSPPVVVVRAGRNAIRAACGVCTGCRFLVSADAVTERFQARTCGRSATRTGASKTASPAGTCRRAETTSATTRVARYQGGQHHAGKRKRQQATPPQDCATSLCHTGLPLGWT